MGATPVFKALLLATILQASRQSCRCAGHSCTSLCPLGWGPGPRPSAAYDLAWTSTPSLCCFLEEPCAWSTLNAESFSTGFLADSGGAPCWPRG